MNRGFQIHRTADGHVSDGDLLLYSDGEAPARDTSKITSHLQACWTCRATLGGIENTISDFVDYLNHDFAAAVGPPPLGWRTFPERLDRVVAEMSEPPRKWPRPAALSRRSWVWSSVWNVAAGVVLAAVVGTIVILFSRVSNLSANQLIRNAQEAQDRRTIAVPEPVIYQRLRVWQDGTPPASALTWDIWNDVDHHRFHELVEVTQGEQSGNLRRVDSGSRRPRHAKRPTGSPEPVADQPATIPPMLRELEQMLRANQMDPASPLSPVGYESWRESLRRPSEDVQRTNSWNGEDTFTLTTVATGPFPANAIIKAALVIRASDWHPVAQQLEYQGEEGVRSYQLKEITFEVTSLKHIDSTLFHEPAAPAPLQPTATSPMPYPSALDSLSAEIRAQYALHHLRACTSDFMEVSKKSSGHIGIHGVTQTSARRQEILDALQGIRWLQVNIETAAEASLAGPASGRRADNFSNETGDPPTRIGPVFQAQSGKLPIEDQLQDYFGRSGAVQVGRRPDAASVQRQIVEISKQAVSLSLAASAEAGALRDLAERYRSSDIEELDAVNRWLLEVMVRDHLTSLKSQMEQSRALLNPVLSAVGGEKLPSTPTNDFGVPAEHDLLDAHWTSSARAMFAAVQDAERLTDYLFAGASMPPGEAAPVARLLDDLNRFPEGLERLQAQINEDF